MYIKSILLHWGCLFGWGNFLRIDGRLVIARIEIFIFRVYTFTWIIFFHCSRIIIVFMFIGNNGIIVCYFIRRIIFRIFRILASSRFFSFIFTYLFCVFCSFVRLAILISLRLRFGLLGFIFLFRFCKSRICNFIFKILIIIITGIKLRIIWKNNESV